MPWDPERYHQFQQQRAAPFEDAIRLVNVRAGLKAVDLGCGTGELTRRLADALPDCEMVGIDSSPEMLNRAVQHARPGLRFEVGTIEAFSGEYDLIFSHAALHWVDDHPTLIPRLFSCLRPGGQIVVQMPSNHSHATHRLITEIAGESPFRQALDGWSRRSSLLGIETYAELLFRCDATHIVVFEKIYPHLLENADALADWTAGTALVPYAERLGEARYAEFMAVYRERLRRDFPSSPVFYGFRRTLFAATRPE